MKYILTLIVLLFMGHYAHQATVNANNRAFVQSLCDWSHTHNEGSLEQRCGDAQDQTHTEYLCVTRSTDLNCWVETK